MTAERARDDLERQLARLEETRRKMKQEKQQAYEWGAIMDIGGDEPQLRGYSPSINLQHPIMIAMSNIQHLHPYPQAAVRLISEVNAPGRRLRHVSVLASACAGPKNKLQFVKLDRGFKCWLSPPRENMFSKLLESPDETQKAVRQLQRQNAMTAGPLPVAYFSQTQYTLLALEEDSRAPVKMTLSFTEDYPRGYLSAVFATSDSFFEFINLSIPLLFQW